MTLNYIIELDADEAKALVNALGVLDKAQKVTDEVERTGIEDMCSRHSSNEISDLYEKLFYFVAVTDCGKRELRLRGLMD